MNRNKQKNVLKILIVVVMIGLIGGFVYVFIFNTPSNQAQQAVEEFYKYEQEGAFAESWDMFHPYMKERFEKGKYLEDRPHVFLNHFGVNTFTFTIDDTKQVRDWQMEEDAEPIDEVYKITVTQYFQGIYGNFEIVQDVYATLQDDEWTILWDYKKSETNEDPEKIR
ncbi:hypothetical protein [Ornithinibacillus sp. 179-J 7C1 HS]|uniref:hypothetical protein n=1 Tax=Ornithinibacillus sp. 179-J 7C1 HS TaxID=3142384 RepID=UPI00399FC4BC